MKQAVIYARVSTQQQENEKTIESQLEELRGICKKEGIKIVEEYIDNGWPGSTLARPALDKLRDDAQKGLFEKVFIYSSDRLGRDHIDQGIVLREFKKANIEIVFKDRLLTDDNKLLTDIESLLAEYERRQFLERTRRGKMHKARNKFVGYVPKLGYRYIKKTSNQDGYLEIDKEGARTIRAMFDLYIKHRSTGQVARELNSKGMKTQRGSMWTASRISTFLKNELFSGQGYFNQRHRAEPKIKKKYPKRIFSSSRVADRKDWIPYKSPAIITKEKFDLVHSLRKESYGKIRIAKRLYLLGRGLLRCGECGSSLVGETQFRITKKGKNMHSYYRCNNGSKRFPLPATCSIHRVKSETIEEKVWDFIKQTLSNPKFLIDLLFHYNNQNKDIDALKLEQMELLKSKERIKQNKNKLFDLYEIDSIDKEELAKRMGDYTQAEKQIDKDIKEIQERITQINSKETVIKGLKEFCKLNKAQFVLISPQQKRDLLRSVLKQITYNEGTGEIDLIGHIPITQEMPVFGRSKDLSTLVLDKTNQSPQNSSSKSGN